MIVEQIVEIPANRRITLEIPKTVPEGKTILTFTPVSASRNSGVSPGITGEALKMADVRQLLNKEMIEKGTSGISTTSGDGWEAHVTERYAES